jgi:hypothetical protein
VSPDAYGFFPIIALAAKAVIISAIAWIFLPSADPAIVVV